jgi:diaminopimelate decarboxylase
MAGRLSAVLQKAIGQGLLEAAPHAALFYDLDTLGCQISALQSAFPPATLHAVAIKACPFTELLRRVGELGCGAEAASAAELEQALRAGIPPERIVFDSPAKTVQELGRALSAGVHINADSIQEIDRIAGLLESGAAATSIGVRINPGIGSGSIEATSTAMPGTKFGVSLEDDSGDLLRRFERYAWLTGLHVHVGSQGCPLALLVDGVDRMVEFAGEVNRRCGAGRISTLDIGGGLPASYRPGERAIGFDEYAAALGERIPSLFSGGWRLITEFGRAIWANTGWAASRVEYTKTSCGRKIAVVHFGADMFVRTAYAPGDWHHELSVFDAAGGEKRGEPIEQDVAGPLCFSGDLLARGRALPPIEPGDHVVVHDAGAYTLAMWSRYNSRMAPPVYGYSTDRDELLILKSAEAVSDVSRFWDA